MRRAPILDFLAVLAASLVVLGGVLYALVSGNYDETTFVVSIALPLVLGSAIIAVRKDKVLLFAFLAYIWAVVDDGPVFFDSVLTWPEVTRFHPFLPRLFMNIVIHALTAAFMYLAVRESAKGRKVRAADGAMIFVLALVAFVLAYAQNIPLAAVQNLVEADWYQFDIAEKLTSIFVFYLTVRAATVRGRADPTSTVPLSGSQKTLASPSWRSIPPVVVRARRVIGKMTAW